jgi:hypothetical protein
MRGLMTIPDVNLVQFNYAQTISWNDDGPLDPMGGREAHHRRPWL